MLSLCLFRMGLRDTVNAQEAAQIEDMTRSGHPVDTKDVYAGAEGDKRY
jgi:hypothetical protein